MTMVRRDKRMLKEDMYVKNDSDMLGETTLKQGSTIGNRGRSKSESVSLDSDKGVPDMELLEESEMLDLSINGNQLSNEEKKKKNKWFNLFTFSVMVLVFLGIFFLGMYVYSLIG